MSSSSRIFVLKIESNLNIIDLKNKIIKDLSAYIDLCKDSPYTCQSKYYIEYVNSLINAIEKENSINSFKDIASIFKDYISQVHENIDDLFIMIESKYASDAVDDPGFVLFETLSEFSDIKIKEKLRIRY